jgi:hypothetical protein
MARPYKFRDKRTNEIIEFEWDNPTPPTKFDIDRIVSERRSQTPEVEKPTYEGPGIFTPRFPVQPSNELPQALGDIEDPFSSPERQPDFRSEVSEKYIPQPDLDMPPTFGGEFKKGYNWATKPIMKDVEEDIFSTIKKYDPTGIAEPVARFGLEGATSPLGLVTGGIGAFAALKGAKAINALRGAGKASKLEPITEDVARGITAGSSNMLDDLAPPPGALPTSSITTNPAAKIVEEELPSWEAILPQYRTTDLGPNLPRDLKGAAPRYGMGKIQYQPQFESDLDKALYIVAQGNKNKRHDDYVKFITDNTGMTPEQAVAAGREVRTKLKGILSGQEEGIVKVPSIWKSPTALDKIDELPETLSPKARSIVERMKAAPEAPPTGKTTAVLTGDETTPAPPQAKIVAEKQTSAVPPSAQEEQSINEFVPKNMTEAIEQLESLELKMRKAGKDETFINHFSTQFWNFPKASWATLDLSAPFRQGKGLIYRGEYWRSFDDMLKSAMSEQGYIETMAKIYNKPTYALMKKYDPGIIHLDKGGQSLLKQEEARMSDWAENIPSLGSMMKGLKEWDVKHARTYVFDPQGVGAGKEALGKKSLLSRGVRASNRAYSGFLNTLRADTFENMVLNYEKMGMSPYTDPELLKATADFISTATGRASLGKFEAAAETLNKYSFSIRFAKSRLDMGVLAPVKWAGAPDPVKKEVMKSLVGHALYTSSFLTLAHAAGAEVILDPTSSDFGKARIGNTRIDTMAGMQQPIVAVTRILSKLSTSPTTGKTTELGEGYRPETGIDVGANFVRTKLSPWTGLGWDLVKGKTISGKETTDELQNAENYGTDNYLVKMITPNLISTIADLAQEDPAYLAQLGIPLSRFFTPDGKPIPVPVIISKLGLVGMSAVGEGVQVFDEPPPQSKRKKGYTTYSYRPRR